jgi:hypothetical protein
MTATPTLAPAKVSSPARAPEHVVPAPTATGRGLGLGVVFSAVFGLFGWAVGISSLSDNSFFWHLRTGEYILDHGIPHHDVFSYTAAGTPWVAQSWLAEVTYGALFRVFGAFGVRCFVGVVGACIGVLAYRLALRLVRDRVVACGITLAALAGIYTLWSERPLLIGVLFFLVLLWTVEVPDSLVGRHPMIALPVLFWLWANVHGSFALGFAYLGLHLLGRWVDGARPWDGRERLLLAGGAIAFAAAFVNPYGAELVTFPIALLSRGDILSHIIEWRSPDFRKIYGFALGIWIAVYVGALARGRNRVSRRDLVVTLPMLFLALWALRNVAIAPLVGLPVVARAFARDEERPDGARRTIVVGTLALIAFLGLVIGLRASQQRDFAFASYPVKAMDYVEHHGLLGTRLLTSDADAGYVILEHYPDQRVFIDDRYDMYPTTLIYDYFTLSDAKPGWSKILDRYHVEAVVWKRGSSLASQLDASPAWRRVHRDKIRAVWVRQD